MKRQAAICFAIAAVACLVFQPGTAAAQKALSSDDILSIVRSKALDPVGQAVRRGQNYVVPAIDSDGGEVLVTVQAQRGRILSVRSADLQDDANFTYELLPPDAEGRIVYVLRQAVADVGEIGDTRSAKRVTGAKTSTQKANRTAKRASAKSRKAAARATAKAARTAPFATVEPAARIEPAAKVEPAPRVEPPARAEPAAQVAPPAKADTQLAEPETTATTPPFRRGAAPRPAAESSPGLAVSPQRRIIDSDSQEGASYPAQNKE